MHGCIYVMFSSNIRHILYICCTHILNTKYIIIFGLNGNCVLLYAENIKGFNGTAVGKYERFGWSGRKIKDRVFTEH